MPNHRPSRRTLLGAIAATPAASIPLPLAIAAFADWQAAVGAWQNAETRIAHAHARFNAAERNWFAARGDRSNGLVSAARIAMEQAQGEHDRQLDLHQDALNALLNTRAPDPSATIWKLDLIRTMLGPDWPELLDFLPADLRALQGDQHGL